MDRIDSFRNEFFYLSNFYEAPIIYDGLEYQNNEAAFQAQKCINKENRIAFTQMNPSEAKKAGQKISLRKDWENVKVSVMKDIVREKFLQNPDLKERLLDTGNLYLEEGNTWGDRVWGTVDGKGANNLGFILMEVREELRQREKSKANVSIQR